MPAAKQKPTPSPDATAAQPKNLVQISIPTPDGDAASESNKALIYAESFAVVSASDSAKAQEARARLNTRIKILTDARMALTRPIDAAKKTIMDFFAGPIATLTRAKGILDEKVIAYDNEQEQIRKAEQRRLDKIAEDERKRLDNIAAETKRKADAEAEELRKQAAEKEAAGDREAAAKLKAKAGRVEEKADAKVEVFEQRASSVVAPIVQAETARIAGTQMRDNWKWRVKDKTKINDAFMMKVTNDAAIDGVVKSMKDEAPSVVGEGIEVYNDRGLASRRT
jgi:hypothetical protein